MREQFYPKVIFASYSSLPIQAPKVLISCISCSKKFERVNGTCPRDPLMPAERFSRGEKAMLAHTIAERLKMDVFLPFFQQRWGVKGMAVAYSKYINTKESSCFKQQLDGIK